MILSRLVLLIASLLNLACAFTLRGRIPFDGLLTNVTLSPSARVNVGSTGRSALIRQDGSFEIFNLADGTYTLTPVIPGYVFPSYLVVLSSSSPASSVPSSDANADVSTSDSARNLTPHIQLLLPGRSALPTSSISSMPYPVQLRPLANEDYYTPVGGVNVLGMLKSPIVLMMLFSGLMMYAMPKLMASVDADPELKKEMAEARRRINGVQSDWTGSRLCRRINSSAR